MGISLGNLVQRMRSPSSMVDYSEYAPSTMMGYQSSVAPLYQLRGYSPFYVGEGDIYSQIMSQQAAPQAMANYYPGFTGGYDTGLYQRMMNQMAGQGSDVSGLLDTGGGMGGDAGGFGADGGGFGGGDSGGGGFGGGDSGGGGDGGYAKGGKVTMRGLLVDETLPGPDDGYAALQAGEYVIKKSTTKKLGDKKLQALNEGRASIKMRKE